MGTIRQKRWITLLLTIVTVMSLVVGTAFAASGSFTVVDGKITMSYSGGSTADKGSKVSETGATFQT